MAFRNLERRVDQLALEASRLQRERDAHAARGVAILRARLATPTALALCFAAGMLVGWPSPPGPARRAARREGEGQAESGAVRLLNGPLGTAALRLASAYVAGAVTGPGREA